MLAGLSTAEVDALVLDRLASFPDEPYFDAVEAFLPSADAAYFNEGPLALAVLVHIRASVIARLRQSNDWQWHIDQPSTSVTFDLGPPLAALFIHAFQYGAPPQRLLLANGLERMDPFMESLCVLTEAAGGSLYVARLFLGMVEVKVLPRHHPYALRAAAAWLAAYPDSTAFWVDHGIGGRLCRWLEAALSESPGSFSTDAAVRAETERILNALIRVGVAPATAVETTLQRLV